MTPTRIVEPLDPDRHDRAGFSCGVDQIDNFFRRTAAKLSRADNLRTFVMVDTDGSLIGFYALNAHAVDYADLPGNFARTRPGHGIIPAAFIAMIAVHRDHQGRGYGGDLLVDALRRIARASDQLGIAVVLLDVLDCGDSERVALRDASTRPTVSDRCRLARSGYFCHSERSGSSSRKRPNRDDLERGRTHASPGSTPTPRASAGRRR